MLPILRLFMLSSVVLLNACMEQAKPAMAAHKPVPAVPAPELGAAMKIRGTCVLRPERVVKLKSQIGGQVQTVLVQTGDRIGAEQVLATIDIAQLLLRKERLQMDLERIRTKMDLLKFQITRSEKEFLVVNDIAGKSGSYLPQFGKEMAALTERRSELKDAELSAAINNLDIRVIDDQIKKSKIRSPINGVVLARNVEPGMVVGSGSDSVGGGDVIFEVANPGSLLAACVIKEADAMLIETGSKARLVIENANKSYPATVARLSPVIANDAGISRREFTVALTEQSLELLPGMNAIVEFEVH